MKTKVFLICILILGYICLNQYSRIKSLKEDVKILSIKTDTVIYKDREIKIPEPYPVYLPPKIVEVYKTDTIRFDSIHIQKEYITVYLPGDSINVNNSFLALYPNNPKLISFDLSKKKFNLDLLDINGMVHRDKYDIDLERYSYRYVDNKMSLKNKSRFKLYPEVGYTFRPKNNLHDFKGILNFNTGDLIYEVGFQGSYYPNLKSDIFLDGVIGIKYKF